MCEWPAEVASLTSAGPSLLTLNFANLVTKFSVEHYPGLLRRFARDELRSL